MSALARLADVAHDQRMLVAPGYGLDGAFLRLTIHQPTQAATSPTQMSSSSDPMPPNEPATISKTTSSNNPWMRDAMVTVGTVPT